VALKSSIPPRTLRAFDTLQTTIRRAIPPGPATEIRIELYEEIANYDRVMSQVTP
jgi:hypothetical protein